MFKSNDGKGFTNRPPMMAHNRSIARMGSKSEAGGADLMEKRDLLAQPGEPDGDEQDGAAIAAEHGPAHEVHVMHDHEAGHHEVHSVHPDGHEHHSDHHASAEAAHEHAKKLAGGHEDEMGNQDEEEAPEYE